MILNLCEQTMLDILNTVSDPDLSLPSEVTGIELNDIGREIYREIRVNKKKAKTRQLEMRQQSVMETEATMTESKSLVQSLTMLEV